MEKEMARLRGDAASLDRNSGSKTLTRRPSSRLDHEATITDVAELGVFFEDLLKGSVAEKKDARSVGWA